MAVINGSKDIQAKLGTPDFGYALALVIQEHFGLSQLVVDFVLHQPRKEEMPDIEHAPLAVCWLGCTAAGDFTGAQ